MAAQMATQKGAVGNTRLRPFLAPFESLRNGLQREEMT